MPSIFWIDLPEASLLCPGLQLCAGVPSTCRYNLTHRLAFVNSILKNKIRAKSICRFRLKLLAPVTVPCYQISMSTVPSPSDQSREPVSIDEGLARAMMDCGMEFATITLYLNGRSKDRAIDKFLELLNG